ncbi:MAG: hypothetical protein ACM3VW_09925, partial [Bacteroidota bacterium]
EQRGDMDQILMPKLPRVEEDATVRLPGQRKIDIQALVNRAKEAGKRAGEGVVAEPMNLKALTPKAPQPAMTAARTDRAKKPAAARKPAGECPYKAGSKIVHAKFGGGVVVSVKDGDDPELTIAFPKGGVKKILASFVKPG